MVVLYTINIFIVFNKDHKIPKFRVKIYNVQLGGAQKLINKCDTVLIFKRGIVLLWEYLIIVFLQNYVIVRRDLGF